MSVAAGVAGPRHRRVVLATLVLGVLILGCAYHGKVRANLRNSENYNIARSLYAGEGFANAIGAPTGPTAWCAPIYPLLESSLLWLGEGSGPFLIGCLVGLHLTVLLGTVVFVLVLATQTTRSLGVIATATVLFLALVYHFWWWFTVVQDCWLMLLTLDGLIAGACWLWPLDSRTRAAVWGLIGGLCALVNPSIGFAWGLVTVSLGIGSRAWARTVLTLGCAALVLVPWTIRNYLVFGRLVPVKANVAYELYQSQCLQADGLYESRTSPRHPTSQGSQERQEYKKLGEAAYLERKWQQFLDAVAADPEDFVDRVAARFLGATLWYVPFFRAQEESRPWRLWARRVTHPLPFLAMLCLLFTAVREPLQRPQWIVIGVYLCYLLPYIGVSYYERYAVPLLAVKTLLVVWTVDRLLTLGGGGVPKSPSPEGIPVVSKAGSREVAAAQ
jgi:hypothetical protein